MAHLDVAPVSGEPPANPSLDSLERLPPALGYAASLVMVGLAVVIAYVVRQTVQAPNLSLVFVLPVVIAAVSFGWGPALVAAVAGVALFDFFFVEPVLSFQVANPTDLWAMGLLLAVAAIVSAVAGESRRRAFAAKRTAEQAEALHALAHAAIRSEPHAALLQTAAASLGRIFAAPAVVLEAQSGKLTLAATTPGAELGAADREAADWALANGKPTRADTYPFEAAVYDFWPVSEGAGRGVVMGVKLDGRPEGRPQAPERQIEMVAAYLATATGAAVRKSQRG